MSDLRQQWFKIWAAEALLSDDLDDLSDHEERVWWRLVMVASLEKERWTFNISEKTARKCHTKLPKLIAATEKFIQKGMLTSLTEALVFVENGPKWNEQTERKKSPSDSKEAVKARVARFRNAKRNDACNDACNDAHKEKEKEKEEEKEEESADGTGAVAPRAVAKRSIAPEGETPLPPPEKTDESVAPKRRPTRKIEPKDIARWQQEHPTVDIPAMIADYENWKGSDGHHDRVLGFANQLRDAWRREKFAKAQGRQIFKEEGIFAGND